MAEKKSSPLKPRSSLRPKCRLDVRAVTSGFYSTWAGSGSMGLSFTELSHNSLERKYGKFLEDAGRLSFQSGIQVLKARQWSPPKRGGTR